MIGRGSNEHVPPVKGTLAQKVSCAFCLLYAVFAIVAVPFVFKLLKGDNYRDDNDTIIIAIKVCRPKDVEYDFNGSSATVTVDGDDELACKGVGFLAIATVASLIVSATTSIIYAYKDVRSIPRKGTLNLMFILLQSSLVTSALISEVIFWEISYRDVFEAYYDGKNINVRAHGSKILIILACAMSFCACLSLVVRKIAGIRRPTTQAPGNSASDPASTPTAEPQPKENFWASV